MQSSRKKPSTNNSTHKRPGHFAGAFVLLAFLAFSTNGCGTAETKDDGYKFDPAKYTGPNFQLKNIAGEDVQFTDFLGKGPVAINFWGTWCAPCRVEMPEFRRIYDEYKDLGVEIIGISLRNTPQQVLSYCQPQRFTWPQVIGDVRTIKMYGNIRGFPTTIIYDRDGKELFRHMGPLRYAAFRSELEKALAIQDGIAPHS